jgi:hypothetical protein
LYFLQLLQKQERQRGNHRSNNGHTGANKDSIVGFLATGTGGQYVWDPSSMTSVYCRFLSIFQLRQRQHLFSCFVPLEPVIMLGAINWETGGTHYANIHMYENTGKKFKRIKYSQFCVCVNSVLLRICCVCTQIHM